MVDLRAFCSRIPAAGAMLRPVSTMELTVATDGIIAVVVPRRPDVPVTHDARAYTVIERVQRCRAPLHLPPHVDFLPTDARVSIDMMAGIFESRYIRQVWSLPDVRVGGASAPREPLEFVFTGGAGVVMPRLDRHRRHITARAVA